MLEYRVFLIGKDGHIKAAEEMLCHSDDDACDRAREILTGCPEVEVWCGNRRIATLPNARFLPPGEVRAAE